MINAIIFDWAGVISDNVQNVYEVTMAIFRKRNVPEISFEKFRDEWEQPYMRFYQKYIPDITLGDETDTFIREITSKPMPHAFPGITEIVKKLHTAGKKLIVLSGDVKQTIIPEMEKFKIKELFHEINYAVHDKAAEVQDIVNRNNLDVTKTVIIGDTVHETETGKSVGMRTGAVTWGFNKEEKLIKAKPDYIFREVSDLETLLS
ncbi:HAD family hydrolase [Patescibacteria group bacterium]